MDHSDLLRECNRHTDNSGVETLPLSDRKLDRDGIFLSF